MFISKAVLWCAFLAAVVAARPADRENEIVGVDVERTVGQVQAILERNKELPRLTRSQIVALLEDITSEDAKSLSKSVESLCKSVESPSLEVKPLPGTEQKASTITKYVHTTAEVINKHTTPTIDEDFVATTPKLEVYNANSFDIGSASSSAQEVKTEADIPNNSGQVMVVLPYTLDGTTLDELYTRPPRVTVVPAYTLIPHSSSQKKENMKNDEKEDITVIPLNPSSSSSSAAINIPENDDEKSSVASTSTPTDVEVYITKESSRQKENGSSSEAAHNSTGYPDISEDLRDFFNNHGLVGNPDLIDSDILSGFKPLPSTLTEYGDSDLPEKYLLSYDLSRESDIADPIKINEDIPSEHLFFPYDYDHAKGEETYELDALSSDMKGTLLKIGMSPEQLSDIDGSASSDSTSYEVIPLENGPDPVSLSDDNVSNELFKRQNSNETSSSGSSSQNSDQSSSGSDTSGAPVPAVTTTSTTTEQPRNPSLSDLADSFGGPANVDPSESELPPPKKNGFYFSLDWNSFLEVGDGDSKVNIRFEPKLGDPQMFLPVSIP